jgi:hypothetical protein
MENPKKDMTVNLGQEIVKIIVEETRGEWEIWVGKERYSSIDSLFLRRGFEQLRFNANRFYDFLERHNVGSIKAIGSILNDSDPKKYSRDYAGSLEKSLYKAFQEGKRGESGIRFYESVSEYMKSNYSKGGKFWVLLWYMLQCCRILREDYNSSFLFYLKNGAGETLGYERSLSDDEFKNLSDTQWEKYYTTRPWNKLMGIGENTFPYIISDVADLKFKDHPSLVKLDATNISFSRNTGIIELAEPGAGEKERYIDAISRVRGAYPFRTVNSAIYVYNSRDYGGKCSDAKCRKCSINHLCVKLLSEDRI